MLHFYKIDLNSKNKITKTRKKNKRIGEKRKNPKLLNLFNDTHLQP